MDILEAIRERRSSRAYKTDQVPRETVAEILRLAINAPSAINLQPWEFVVVMGEEKDRLSRKLLKTHQEKRLSCGPKAVRPLPEAVKKRGRQNAEAIKPYIERTGMSMDDFVAQGSCDFYGAPVAIIICLDDCFETMQRVDVGAALAYLVLTAHAFGLATCPVGLVADCGDEVKDLLNIPDDKSVVVGVALGYPDREHPMGQYRSPRDDLSTMVRWI